MKVQIDKKFQKDVLSANVPKLNLRIESAIVMLQQSSNLLEVSNLKKLAGFKTYYRIRVGDYRIGFELIDQDTVLLVRFMHRKDIYNRFP